MTETTHKASYQQHRLGQSPISNRPLYGWNVTCSCGWERRSNENKASVAQDFRWHVKEAQKEHP